MIEIKIECYIIFQLQCNCQLVCGWRYEGEWVTYGMGHQMEGQSKVAGMQWNAVEGADFRQGKSIWFHSLLDF